MKKTLRLAVDTGGTFTDLVVLDEESGKFSLGKVPTTPSNTMIGVLNAIDKLEVDLAKIDKFFIHGSTTATNTLIEGKGAKTAYIGTEGFRDVPEIARYNRPDIFNPKYKKPPLIVPRHLRFEVKERMLVTGEVFIPLDVESVREVAKKIERLGIESVAVCLHHAYKNPAHEQKVRDIILEECPDVYITISSEVAKEHREYERGMTTIIDAYIKPVVAIWIDELDAELKKRGMDAELLLTRSDGGSMRAQMGKDSPVNTLLSGPAGGVMGAVFLAGKTGTPNIITMDMGGTSFDVCVIKDGEPETRIETKAEGYELLIPNLDIRSVGTGGGSIAWIDAAGAFHVGPQSAGAVPGPICYSQGGTEPTVTDAAVCTGYIDPKYFLGGEMSLDVNLARDGIMSKIAKPLSLGLEAAAAGMLSISYNHMVQAIRGITVESGYDPRDFSLLCYGGGGPLFGSLMANELGMKSAIIPSGPANFSAWGMLMTDIKHAFPETDIMPLDKVSINDLNKDFDKLAKQGLEVLIVERISEENRELMKSLDMRYVGQEHYVNVPINFSLDNDFRAKIKKEFDRIYHSVFGYILPQPIEIVNFRVAAIGHIPNPPLRQIEVSSADANTTKKDSRRVYDFVNRTPIEYGIYERPRFLAGNVVDGPALIEEPTSVTHVPAGSQCVVDRFGNLIITRKSRRSKKMMKTKTADVVTIEIIRNYFISLAYEMRRVLERGSFNPIIYEMRDFSLGIYDKNYELIAQDPGVPLFTGALSMAAEAMVNYIGKDTLEDEDTIISSYPYDTGSHPNDVNTVTPVFVDGEIFAYTATKAHWLDVGGKDVYMTDTTDMYQEGLLLRSVKIKKKGTMNEEIVDIIRLNSRFSDSTIGDLNAQIAAAEYGKKRILALVDKYGKEVVADVIVQIMEQGEKITRDIIRGLPDGEWSAEGALDDDGINIGVPVPIKLTVTIKGDEMTLDTTGSSEKTEGPMNCPLATTVSILALLSKVLLTPQYPSNGGYFRPLKIIAPEGSLFNAQPPAPVCLYHKAPMCIFQLGYKALAEAMPDKVVARSGNDLGGLLFSAVTPYGTAYGGGCDECQGQGAWIDSDGTSALCDLVVGDSCNVPGEIIETRYPFFVERYSLRNDSGGPGKFRGGLGVEKHLQAITDVRLIVPQEQHKTPAWGLFGGKSSSMPETTILKAGTEHEWTVGKITGYRMQKGERLLELTGGGGGWGDPFKRDPQRVLDDVINEYVSIEKAREDYGVVIKKEGEEYTIDQVETGKLRNKK